MDGNRDFIENILSKWGFSPSVIESFVANQIDEESFILLSEVDIKELIPQLGIRIKFIAKHHEYVLLKKAANQPLIFGEVDEPTESISTISISDTATSGDVSINTDVDLDNLQPKECIYSAKATLGQPFIITEYSTNSKELLESSEEGTIIKNSYNPNSKFLRTALCNLIVKNELKNAAADKRISTDRFIQLAKEINDIFIHEDASIYYVPYCRGTDGKVVAARGKLWSTYVHQRQLYKKAGLLKNRSDPCSSSTTEEFTYDDTEDVSDLMLWIKNNSEPFEQVLNYWKKTAQERLKCSSSSESIDQYFKTFPVLGKSTGYILLESDFIYTYPDKENTFFIKWPAYGKIIYNILRTKRNSYLKELLAKHDNLSDECAAVIALKYLPLLLQAPLIKCKVKHWKPSKQELVEGFILWIDDIGDLDTALQTRIDKYYSYKLTAQPGGIQTTGGGTQPCRISKEGRNPLSQQPPTA